jgi:protease-4
MKFLRNLLASILGFFIAIFLMITFFALIGSAFSEKEKVTVKEKSILKIKLEKPIKDDYNVESPFSELFKEESKFLKLHQILNAIENAKNDDKIKGISIEIQTLKAGLAQTQAIRKKLKEFKESGKFITAFSDGYSQKNYYLSTVADSLYLNPISSLDLKGLGTELLFFKDFEDKYGVKFEVIRHGKYKSAVEPFISNKMSEANRTQITELLQDIWSEFKNKIANSRNKTADAIDTIADELGGRNAKLAKQNNLINDTIYHDQYETLLKKQLQVKEDKKINYITLQDYIKTGKGRKKVKISVKDKIAVVYAQGEIKYGEGDETYIGQESIIKALRKAVKDKKVKAIVLRVNSPGGSALASDIIWRELEQVKKKKPLIVSMGNLAASGGYYISCNADRIFAQPTTITGSIGVFGMLPNVKDFADRIGINAEQVQTNKHSIPYSIFEPMSKDFKSVVQESIEQIYDTFISRVAKGRKMDVKEVDKIAQGRVWTGNQALKIGLVDELGSLEDAIAYAAKITELKDYKIKNLPRYKKDLGKMLSNSPFMKAKLNEVIQTEIGNDNYKILSNFKHISQLKGIQMRMPFVMEIK